MELLRKLFGKTNPDRRRGYAGAKMGRLTADWVMQGSHINEDLRHDLPTLRGRSRDLSLNNPYVVRYLNMLKSNIVGNQGIRLQAMAVELPGNEPDKAANKKLEEGWRDWCNNHASVDGRSTFHDIENRVIESLGRDGEVFIRMHRSSDDNPFGFSIEQIDPSRIDESLNEELKGGNSIHLGVEFSRSGRPVAYYIKMNRALEGSIYLRGAHYERVPAEQMLHIGKQERPGQVRFAPWIAPVMGALKQLDGYQEGELIAARIAASKMGFFTTPDGGQYGEEDAAGNFVSEAEPGIFEQLPEGWDFKSFDPQHPAGNYSPFIKATLRTIASGLNVSYHSLSGDLESVNYSSIRQGALEERDRWRMDQNWLLQQLHTPIYRMWLPSALLTQAVQLPIQKLSKFGRVKFRPRGFGWVDPLKDMKAATEGVALSVESRSDICARHGVDFEDVVEQLSWEKALLEENGLLADADGETIKDEEVTDDEPTA